ncbi:TetR/AcrR family transcriptional regulator [Mycobacteroides immunogenum]|uniref:TetR family transcriptional regulator n=1 Tax=Mycobacteroides immunogenum TaxID=83262 RepID=A0A7V8LT15_9MYCO|nr:TetR/AcrR family transcriptional regulator [Mycobacteroides immunogenum]AMT71458.1 TetR family transcriptional regulator [Mycobacteroides immunogenum]ANO04570.1 TetR family transcriptional regulator [Mycobacteroides immunogenum]KIU42355.1 TetR family transcriptional regulator [Mycobacteroides immunogenum]KPG15064.1 TetR family transcriptional regulator [Mycobacteroides immunogenum]KPG15679.1 TetR family transcriptional regulator [Mycobacteroides immunogenum]
MRSEESLTFTERARRAQIVAGAIEVLAGAGYPQTSLAKIAEHVGVAKSAVLYHFTSKTEVIESVMVEVFTRAATTIVPAVHAQSTATARLTAYIRANIEFIVNNRVAAIALLEIITGYRSQGGLRFDQAAAETAPPAEFAAMDPESIFADGVATGEFQPLSPRFMKTALRAALDGAVWELGRDVGYDATGYGEQLVQIFTKAVGCAP